MKSKAVEDAARLLEQARAALADAQDIKQKLAEAEIEVATTAQTYTEWRRQAVLADVEVDRLSQMVSRRETELASEQAMAERDEQDRLEADFERDAEMTAKLIAANLAAIKRLARDTMAAIAKSEQHRLAAQAKRSSYLPVLISAETRIRSIPAREREEISDEVVTRWTYASTGSVVGDGEKVERVISSDGKTGYIPTASKHSRGDGSRVELRAYRKVTFHPASPVQFNRDLMAQLSIPGLTALDPAGWSPQTFHSPRSILEHIERLEQKEKAGPPREVLEELLPCEPSLAARALSKAAGMARRVVGADADGKVVANG